MARKLLRSRVPEVEVELKRSVGDRRWFPCRPFVNDLAVDKPLDHVALPVDLVGMKVISGPEAEIDQSRRAAVAVLELRALGTRVVEHVDEELAGILAEELDIDLLAWPVSVKE